MESATASPLSSFSDMTRWKGRVALVTGASVGIGAAIARELVRMGMKVVGCARRLDLISEAAKELSLSGLPGSLVGIQCDLTKEQDIFDLFAKIKELYGGVDVCVNNAGFLPPESLVEGSWTLWDRVLKLNVMALCLCQRLTIESMRERGVDDGQIINICSDSGHFVSSYPTCHFYEGSKFAVKAITEGLRREMRQANSKIRICQISPGGVDTEMLMDFMKTITSSVDSPDNPLGVFDKEENKLLQVSDLANMVVFVLSAPPHVEINDILVRPVTQND